LDARSCIAQPTADVGVDGRSRRTTPTPTPTPTHSDDQTHESLLSRVAIDASCDREGRKKPEPSEAGV